MWYLSLQRGGIDSKHCCLINATNASEKTIILSSVEIFEKVSMFRATELMPESKYYTDGGVHNKEIKPGETVVIVLCDKPFNRFYDQVQNRYKRMRIVVTDGHKNRYKTNWFMEQTVSK